MHENVVQYEKMIDIILNSDQLSLEEKLEKIESEYKVKPVRAKWFQAKAKLIFDKYHKCEETRRILRNKFVTDYCSEDILDILQLSIELDRVDNDDPMAGYHIFQYNSLAGNKEEIIRTFNMIKEEEERLLNDFNVFSVLADLYLECGKTLDYYILKLYEESIGLNAIKYRRWIENTVNFGYLKEVILEKKRVVIVIDSLELQNEAFILGKCLANMGCQVYAFLPPGKIEVSGNISLKDTAFVSMENSENRGGVIIVPTIEIICDGVCIGNNSAYVLDELCNENVVLVLADSKKFEELSQIEVLKNRICNFHSYKGEPYIKYYSFGWAGSYLSYIEQLYRIDAKEALYRQTTCRFSIVIPARNSAAVLQHTLETCLNQRWQGDYEIVISDNSTEGNNEVYQFCQTLQDERVKYYKTPRDLRLNRSFEYAFLQTRGEYVFSIGSDDALLPWTLEVWDQVIRDYPEEEIFLWDRGFYAWPGFNRGQQHQFTVPGKYQKGKYNAEYVEPIQYLSWAMDNPGLMYLLPTLYINSGFKRSFMQTLLNDTGRLWDGICQDIYMGVIVSVIKEKIVRIHYPLSIAGMSSGSVGALANLPTTDQAKSMTAMGRELKENNVGGFSKSQIETLMPELGSDVTSLYNSILRAVNRGLIPKHYLSDVFDWKTWFLNSYKVMNKGDIYFDKKIHQMRFAAMKHGEEFLKWFDETIFEDALEPAIIRELDITTKTYREYNNESGMTLDASKYGVQNSYEASLLFERMTGL